MRNIVCPCEKLIIDFDKIIFLLLEFEENKAVLTIGTEYQTFFIYGDDAIETKKYLDEYLQELYEEM